MILKTGYAPTPVFLSAVFRAVGTVSVVVAAIFGTVAMPVKGCFGQGEGLVYVSSSSSLNWGVLNLYSGQATSLGDLGGRGDFVALGRWLGTGGLQPGVVTVDSSSNDLVWRVRGSSERIVEARFGKAGATVLTAADFDGSGIDDPVIVSKGAKSLGWVIAFDRLRGGTKEMAFTLGGRNERPFFMGTHGRTPLLGTVALSQRSTAFKLLDPRTGLVVRVRGLPALSSGTDYQIRSLRSPQGRAVVAIIRRRNSGVALSLVDLVKRTVENRELPSVNRIVVGDLLSDPGDEYAWVSGANVIAVNPFNAKQVSVAAPATPFELVDSVNIGEVGSAAPSPTLTPTPAPTPTAAAQPTAPPNPTATPSGAGSGSPPASLDVVCASRSAISSGEMLIKSEASDHIHSGDPRTTGYTVVCARVCPRNLGYAQFFYSDGLFAGAVARYGTFRGNGKPRLYGAVGRAPQHFASEIAAKAATIGNGKLYLQISAAVSGTATACKEFNPSGRNGSLY